MEVQEEAAAGEQAQEGGAADASGRSRRSTSSRAPFRSRRASPPPHSTLPRLNTTNTPFINLSLTRSHAQPDAPDSTAAASAGDAGAGTGAGSAVAVAAAAASSAYAAATSEAEAAHSRATPEDILAETPAALPPSRSARRTGQRPPCAILLLSSPDDCRVQEYDI